MKLRESVRALVVDQEESILLVRFDWPGLGVPGGFWANPGGGIEAEESRGEALARELMEEVGLRSFELGPEIWTKTALFPMTHWDGQVDHIHLVQVEHFEPAPQLTTAELLAENVQEIRWWSRSELSESDATFSPRAFPALVEDFLSSPRPAQPLALAGF